MRKENMVNSEIINQTDKFINDAKQDALSRISEKAEVEVLEGLQIAKELTSEHYTENVKDIENFLNTKTGIIVCSDGRILPISIIDPIVARIHRRLAGLPETRTSTRDGSPVSNDPNISASIALAVKERRNKMLDPILVEFIGPHIHSTEPIHGCGAEKLKLTARGRPAETAMQFGAINNYFDELGEGFYALNNVANRAGGNLITYDMIHDSYSQGLIFGLKNLYDKKGSAGMFDKTRSLRDNLILLHKNKNILMTEMMDDILNEEILRCAASRGIKDKLDIRNPEKLGENIIHISQIAKEITTQQEKTDFPFIPLAVRAEKPDISTRALAYMAIRNSTYRLLSGIIPGKHDLIEHPEQLIRVGPIGQAFNVRTLSFIEVTADENLRDQDIDGVKKLYALSEGTMPKLGIKFNEEGRVIIITGEYDKKDYSNESLADQKLEQLTSFLKNSAAALRNEFLEGIKTGETIIISCIYEEKSRKLIKVL